MSEEKELREEIEQANETIAELQIVVEKRDKQIKIMEEQLVKGAGERIGLAELLEVERKRNDIKDKFFDGIEGLVLRIMEKSKE